MDSDPDRETAEHDDGRPDADDGRPESAQRGVLSFVRRGTRLTGKRLTAWDRLADHYVLEPARGSGETSIAQGWSIDVDTEFGRTAPLTVEVGSGLGDAMVAAAAANPQNDYLAIDVYRPGLSDLIRKAETAGATNIRVIEANAPEVLDGVLPAGRVDELWTFFPDPWPKKRHHKRRLVTTDFAALALRVMRDGGLWRLATDWEEYAEQMRDTLDDVVELEPLNDAADGWAERFEGRIETGFERKGREAGRVIRDLTYRRRARQTG